MAGHEEAATLTEDEAKVARSAASIALELLEPMILGLGETLKTLEAVVAARLEALEKPAGPTDETRLDSIEHRLKSFGKGGKTTGDALALADFALASARAVAAAVQRITGATVPLPPAPEQLAVGEPKVMGAETADRLSV